MVHIISNCGEDIEAPYLGKKKQTTMKQHHLSQQQKEKIAHKLENKIRDAKQNLEVIKRTVFLSREIESAKSSIIRINKFKLFRSGSRKKLDLNREERKINEYTIWGELEKEILILDSTKMIISLEEELLEMRPN